MLVTPWMGLCGSKSLLFMLCSRHILPMDSNGYSYSINQLPTDEERKMMDEWIKILVAFVGGNDGFDYGTKSIDELKVLTAKREIKVEKDLRYHELRDLGAIFSQK